jgi:hypothetical protein
MYLSIAVDILIMIMSERCEIDLPVTSPVARSSFEPPLLRGRRKVRSC